MTKISVAISETWYNEIKDLITVENPYFYISNVYNKPWVECDVNEEEFEKVSKELGWI